MVLKLLVPFFGRYKCDPGCICYTLLSSFSYVVFLSKDIHPASFQACSFPSRKECSHVRHMQHKVKSNHLFVIGFRWLYGLHMWFLVVISVAGGETRIAELSVMQHMFKLGSCTALFTVSMYNGQPCAVERAIPLWSVACFYPANC